MARGEQGDYWNAVAIQVDTGAMSGGTGAVPRRRAAMVRRPAGALYERGWFQAVQIWKKQAVL
ncbi:hypothetical protein [Gimesia maris]|uniref:hypothetical protein n=1 Tax=Gimesia maris TaxID=122 RepID=UPI0032EEBB00